MDRAPQQPWLVPDEWEIEEDRYKTPARIRAQQLAYYHRVKDTPEYRARRSAYEARPDVKERMREYHHAYYQQRRAAERADLAGWLHELACDGNHRGNRRCQPIPVYREVAA